VNDHLSPTIFKKLFNRTGKWYPLVVLLIVQAVTTPVLIVLTALPTSDNAGLTWYQGINLTVMGSIGLLFRNALLALELYLFNREMFARLEKIHQAGGTPEKAGQELRAWQQATSFTRNLIFLEFIQLFVLVLFPLTRHGYYSLHLTVEQLVYFSLAVAASGLVIFILEIITLDKLFQPVITALLPADFQTQVNGIQSSRIWVKLSVAFIGLALISLLLTIPTAYRLITLLSMEKNPSSQQLTEALGTIIKAGIGAIASGIVLSISLVFYFTTPFRKMIRLFGEVEKGNLTERIEVSTPDDFGRLNIYINYTINRLQNLTANLEQQVAERTAQLSQANQQLQVELTERLRAQEQLSYSALHDPLTDLPNRVLFIDRLLHAMQRARRHSDSTFAVLYIDLDHFKVVNDSLGHNVGDLLLMECARRLLASVRREDTVARLGGDEFVILLEDLQDPADYIHTANRILGNLASPADLAGHRVFISLSMGIVFGDTRYEQPDDILRDADIAMYQAKKQGRGRFAVFDPEMLQHVMTRLELETDLRTALNHNEFLVHYQPILNLQNQRISGFEALVRWQHPTRGLLLPAEFISTAEETGLIVPLGDWVLDEACRQISAWQQQFPVTPPLTMNVNFSTRQCAEPNFVDKIIQTLQKHRLDAGSLRLELTESLVVENSARTSAMLAQLRTLGIQVHIDDFGTGYSWLSYLHTLPVDTLKIDRSFIGRLGTNGGGADIIQAILTLANSLGVQVVAEGVETDDQFARLKALNCQFMQGFLFSHPVDSEQAGSLIKKSLAGKLL
jgi:diguanylate cyclase (GGDEF)-like protein